MALNRLKSLAFGCLVSLFIVGGANAATVTNIIEDGPFPFEVHTLGRDDVFTSTNIGIGRNIDFTTNTFKYGFNVGSNNPLKLNFFSFLPGFTSLELKVLDSTQAVIAVLDLFALNPTGSTTGGSASSHFFSGVGDGLYTLVISGMTGDTGGVSRKYSLSAQAVVPVPPALLLLVTGLMGAGFLGRRKVGGTKVSV